MQKGASFLQNIQPDPKIEESWIAAYIANPRIVILIVLSVVMLGIYSFINLPRTLNPEIKIPIVIIQTVLPGAGPKEVESLVTVPIEDAVNSLARVKTVGSTSRDSVSIVTLEFESGIDPEKAKTDVRSAVDSVTTLPKDAKTPVVQKLDFENQPIWTFAVTSKDDPVTLMRFSKFLKDKLKDLPSVDNVNLSGFEQQEVQIVLRPQAASTYSVNPFFLSQTVVAALKSFPSGAVRAQDSSFALTVDPEVTTVEDIRNLKVTVGGSQVNLSDIAQVAQRAKPDQPESFLATAEKSASRSVTFDVFRTSSVNINKAIADARQLVDGEFSHNPQFSLYSIRDTGKNIEDQFTELERDFAITIGLVFLTLFIFLGVRQALIAATSIPLTFFASFLAMYASGLTLSFLSLFSLLLALGLLVDDTIVVVSAMTSYFRTGRLSPFQTGLLVVRDFGVAIFTTTITTVWAFVPLLLSTGIIGEFIKPIPIVVSSTLLASFVVAMFVTVPFMVIFLRPRFPNRVSALLKLLFWAGMGGSLVMLFPGNNPLFALEFLSIALVLLIGYRVRKILFKRLVNRSTRATRHTTLFSRMKAAVDNGAVSFEAISERYRTMITTILSSQSARRKVIAVVIIFSVFSFLLLPLGLVKNEFFPKSDQDFVYVSLELPAGIHLSSTEQEALSVIEQLRDTKYSKYTTVDLGRSFTGGSGIGASGFNEALFAIVLEKKHERPKTSSDISQMLREKFKNYKKGKLSVVEVSGGPPAGADLQIKLFGSDLSKLDTVASQIASFLGKEPGVSNIEKSIKPGTSKLVFVPDKAKLAEQEVALDTIGVWLRLYASGFSPDTIKLEEDNNQSKDITFRLDPKTGVSDAITTIAIPVQNGSVPLAALGKLALEPNPTLITREDGKRTLSLTASVGKGFNIPQINQKLVRFADSLQFPAGYTWKTGGVNDENQKSVTSILAAMLLSFLLIIITMVLQFSSFRKALIVMLVIPLSISGVLVIFSLTNTPLSFPALIGVLALFGIVVKNSILIVDKISQNEKHTMELSTAIADGASSRLEAIALTSFATIIGLVPITLSDPIWRGLGGAIIAGLSFSGTIMLLFIPVVYYMWFSSSQNTKKRRNRNA